MIDNKYKKSWVKEHKGRIFLLVVLAGTISGLVYAITFEELVIVTATSDCSEDSTNVREFIESQGRFTDQGMKHFHEFIKKCNYVIDMNFLKINNPELIEYYSDWKEGVNIGG